MSYTLAVLAGAALVAIGCVCIVYLVTAIADLRRMQRDR